MPPIVLHVPKVRSAALVMDFPLSYYLVVLCRSIPSEGRYPSASTNSCQAREKSNEASVICHSKPPSFSSTESSEGGKIY